MGSIEIRHAMSTAFEEVGKVGVLGCCVRSRCALHERRARSEEDATSRWEGRRSCALPCGKTTRSTRGEGKECGARG